MTEYQVSSDGLGKTALGDEGCLCSVGHTVAKCKVFLLGRFGVLFIHQNAVQRKMGTSVYLIMFRLYLSVSKHFHLLFAD